MKLKRPKSPKPPGHLQAHGAALWRDLATEYEISDAAGVALLTTAAECLDAMKSAQAVIAQHGAVILDRYGGLRANPACGLEKDARAGFLAALKALNLDLEPIKNRVGRPAKGAPGWVANERE